MKEIITYKGFNSDMKCYGEFQYEEGKEYETDEPVKCCESGFHSCEYPLDVFCYYQPYSADGRNKYFQTIASGEIDSKPNSDDTKIASSKIKLGMHSLSFAELAQAAAEFIYSKIKYANNQKPIYASAKSIKINTKIMSQGYNKINGSIVANIANKSVAETEGINSIAASIGDCSISTAYGCESAAVNTLANSVSISNGFRSAAVNTGCYSISSSKAPNSAAINTGSSSVSTTTGEIGSVAVCTSCCSVSESNDKLGVAVCTNDFSAASTHEWGSVAVNTGRQGEVETTKICSIAASTGMNKVITNGDRSIAANIAIRSSITCNGDMNVAVSNAKQSEIVLKKSGSIGVCTEVDSWIMGVKGCYFLIQNNKENGDHEARLFLVDGEEIKENTWYHITIDGSLEEDPDHFEFIQS